VKSFAVLAALCLFVLPAVAQADPFSDFRIPDHYWRSGSLNVNFLGDWANANNEAVEARQSVIASILNPSLFIARDSDPLLLSLSLSLAGQASVQNNEQTQIVPTFEGHSQTRGQQTDENWFLSGSLRAYPWAVPVGFGLSGTATGAYRQAWTRTDARNELSDVVLQTAEFSSRQDFHGYANQVVLEGSAGLGRVRDASVVYDVYVLEQRLRETDAITRPLSKEAREKLAALYYVAPFYVYAHDRPDRFVWRDIERVLQEDGALSERGFDPYSVVRARERYFYGIPRSRGWFAGPVAQGRHEHLVLRLDERQSVRFYEDDSLSLDRASWLARREVQSFDEVDLGVRAEYHLPLTWRWQFDFASAVTAPARPGERGLHASSAASATWLVADRWLAMATLSHSRDYFEPRGASSLAEDSWSTKYRLQLGWYLEDHFQVSASLTEGQGRNNVTTFPYLQAYSRERRLVVGFSYRFLGALDAPGLTEPQRPIQ
jgi:hypothetical protein